MSEETKSSPLNPLSLLSWGLLLAFLLYFGLFTLVVLDEMVLGTDSISLCLQPQPHLFRILKTIYWPLFETTRWLLGNL